MSGLSTRGDVSTGSGGTRAVNAVLVVHPNDESQPTIRLSPAFWWQISEPRVEPRQPKGRSSHLVNNSVSNDSAGPRLALPPYLSEPAPEPGRFTSVAFARAGQVPRHPGGYATFAAPNPRGYEPAGEGCVAFSSSQIEHLFHSECCLLAGDDRAPDCSPGLH
jgi:hypothetical protein